MYTLIATIISIILISAMTIASIFYGGASFKNGKLSVEITELISAAQQVSSAIDMAQINGKLLTTQGITDINKLYEKGFLTEIPKFKKTYYSIDTTNSFVKVDNTNDITEDVCKRIIAKNKNIPITNVSLKTNPENEVKYGCYIANSSNMTYTFYFKY